MPPTDVPEPESDDPPAPAPPPRPPVARRTLIQGAAVTAAGVAVPVMSAPAHATAQSGSGNTAVSAPAAPAGCPPLPDFHRGSAALTPDRIVATACQFCNSNCRLQVGLKLGRVIEVRGEPADPVQAGNLCVKGPAMTELVYNRHRLTRPLRRVSGAKGSTSSVFAPVSWDEALDIMATRLLHLRDTGEARAIANRTTGRLPRGVGSLVSRLFAMLGSPNDTDVGPVCNDAGGDALAMTFGLPNFTNGYGVDPATGREDLGSARYLLMLGTNQAETHPVTFAHLLRSREHTGARLVVVDPRRTPTAALADTWVAPKPHTDLALILGVLGHIVRTQRYDRRFVARWTVGFDELSRHLDRGGYDPRWASRITGVPAAVIEQIAEEYATSRPAAIFCNAGISHQLGAFDTYRTIAMLAAITGNIGVPGGGCNFMHNTWPGRLDLPPLAVPLPPRGPALPVGPDAFADAILSGRPYRLQAVITQGNPLVSSANTTKVREAYRRLDFYVYTGLFMEEAAYYADLILPVCSGLEFDGVYMRRDDRGIRWQDAAVPRVGESRTDVEIWVDLAHALSRHDRRRPRRYWTDAFPARWRDYRQLWAEFVAHTPGMGGMTHDRLRSRAEPLRWPCPDLEHPGVSTLYLDHPSWYRAAEALDPAHRGKRFLTPSGKIEITTPAQERLLAPSGHSSLPSFYTHPEVTGAHPTVAYEPRFITNPLKPQALTRPVRLAVPGSGAVHRRYPLMGMTGRPSVAHFATVTHWTPTGKRLNGIRLVQIHPDTARAHGIGPGDDIIVESPRGAVRGTALLDPGIRADTVFVPNTFGPAQLVGDDFADPRYQAANHLIDDRYHDNLSGQQAYKCFACRLRKAPG